MNWNALIQLPFLSNLFVFPSSIPPGKIKTKAEEMDPKKQKKFEKEEKEFRKKFKVCHSNMFQPHLQYLLSYFACSYIYIY